MLFFVTMFISIYTVQVCDLWSSKVFWFSQYPHSEFWHVVPPPAENQFTFIIFYDSLIVLILKYETEILIPITVVDILFYFEMPLSCISQTFVNFFVSNYYYANSIFCKKLLFQENFIIYIFSRCYKWYHLVRLFAKMWISYS